MGKRKKGKLPFDDGMYAQSGRTGEPSGIVTILTIAWFAFLIFIVFTN